MLGYLWKSIIPFSIIYLLSSSTLVAQITPLDEKTDKGQFYIYYGWNASWYTDSDISFTGENYDFTLYDVVAKDRPTAFSFDPYFHPKRFTIPQYNFRIGYHITDKTSISLGVDHMKYVLQNGQTADISGTVQSLGSSIINIYSREPIVISRNFLQYEHTDGLNYINADIRRHIDLWSYKDLSLEGDYGVGGGVVIPRTNTTILGRERYDQFNLAGYALHLRGALDVVFYNNYFIKTELKSGYINMPDVRTTQSEIDTASQSFSYLELTLVFGVKF